MTVTNRNSTLYAKLHVSKYLGDARDRGGRAYPIPFSHTVVSGEVGGASALLWDTVNLCVIPAYAMVVALNFACNALEVSAGVNSTLEIGDSGDTDRYMKAKEFDVENAVAPPMPYAGQNYKPTADTIVIGTWKVGNPKVGAIFNGCIWVVPGV